MFLDSRSTLRTEEKPTKGPLLAIHTDTQEHRMLSNGRRKELEHHCRHGPMLVSTTRVRLDSSDRPIRKQEVMTKKQPHRGALLAMRTGNEEDRMLSNGRRKELEPFAMVPAVLIVFSTDSTLDSTL